MEVVERRVAVWWVGQQVAKSVEQLRASLFPYIPTFSCRYTHVIQERVKMGRNCTTCCELNDERASLFPVCYRTFLGSLLSRHCWKKQLMTPVAFPAESSIYSKKSLKIQSGSKEVFAHFYTLYVEFVQYVLAEFNQFSYELTHCFVRHRLGFLTS